MIDLRQWLNLECIIAIFRERYIGVQVERQEREPMPGSKTLTVLITIPNEKQHVHHYAYLPEGYTMARSISVHCKRLGLKIEEFLKKCAVTPI